MRSVYEGHYRVFSPARLSGCDWQGCFYCGVPADTLDHHPPLARFAEFRARFDTAYHVFVKVPSCMECNMLLGTRMHETLEERADCVKALLKRKYRRALQVPDWTDDEIATMGRNMRSSVNASLALREATRNRLSFREGVAAWEVNKERYSVP